MSLDHSLHRQAWMKAILIGLIFFATQFCGGLFIEGISIRNLFFLLIVAMLFSKPSSLHTNNQSMHLLMLYYAFVSFLGLFNGFYEQEGVTIVLTRFLPTILLVFFLLNYIKTKKELQYTIYVLLVILSLNAIATILQGINHPIGWWIASFFQTTESLEESQNLFDIYNTDSTVGLSIASGFCGSVVLNGYMLGSLGLLVFMPVFWNFNTKTILFSLILLILFSAALFYNQQRMAFYVFHFAVAAVTLTYAFLKKNYTLLFFIVLISTLLVLNFDPRDFNDADFGRLSNFDDEIRTTGRNVFWNSFFPDNFLLGNRTKFVELYGSTPHFLPIETILLGGIVGLAIFMLFVCSLGKSIFLTIYRRNVESFLLSAPIIALLLISLRHSTGFHTGLTLSSFILALFILSAYKLKE